METYYKLVTSAGPTGIQKPMWADGPEARKWQGVMGAALDAQDAALVEARAVRYPSNCPSDALYFLGAERQLEQVPIESEAQWRIRLRQAWAIWHQGGTQEIHRTQFGWYNCLNVRVVRRHEWSVPRPAGSNYDRAFARAVWAQFDVLIQKPHPWEEKLWGSPPPWGTGTWGSTMTAAEIEYFRRQIRLFKAGHDTGTYLHVSFAYGRLWGPQKWGDGGLWGGSNRAMALVIGEWDWPKRGLM